MRTFFIILAILSLTADKFYAQSDDSALRDSFTLYDDLFWANIQSDPEKAMPYARKTAALGEQLGDAQRQITGWVNLANALIAVGNKLDSAEYYANKTIQLAKKENLPDRTAKGYGVLSSIYYYRQNYEKTIEYMDQSMDYAEMANDTLSIIKTLVNKGAVLAGNGKLNEAATCLFRADSLCRPTMYQERGMINNSLGVVFGTMDEIELSNEYYQKAYELLKKAGASIPAGLAMTNLGENAIKKKDFDKAEACYSKADSLIPDGHPNKAGLSWGMAQVELHKENYDKAQRLIKKALAADLNLGDQNKIMTDYLIFAKILEKKKKYAEALDLLNKEASKLLENTRSISKQEYYEQKLRLQMLNKGEKEMLETFSAYLENQDSMLAEQNRKNIIKMKEKYEAEKKQAENEKLLAQNKLTAEKLKTQKLLTWIGVLGTLVLLSLLFVIHRQTAKQKKLISDLADKNARIQLLNREIAHRTKNQMALAVNLLTSQKLKIQDPQARRIIEESESRLKALSAVNKRLSGDTELPKVNIKDVLEEVVANNRYSLAETKADCAISIPDTELDSYKASILALIVNELTVNSFKHAFSPQNQKPALSLDVSCENGSLNLRYADNGHADSDRISKGEGLNLIDGLAKQLRGSYQINTASGFEFKLKIPC